MFWNKEYKGISISFENRIIRIKCDSILMNYLTNDFDALILSKYILETYYDMFHKILEISQVSLAVEILIHAYVDKLCLYLLDKEITHIESVDQVLSQAVESIHGRTEIIDCGEREIDNNRFIFDGLEKFHSVISKMLKA